MRYKKPKLTFFDQVYMNVVKNMLEDKLKNNFYLPAEIDFTRVSQELENLLQKYS